MLFGALAFIQLIMAISSQNNLIYFFVFSEIAIALTSMFYTNYNVYRCYLKKISGIEVFANETNVINVELASSDKKLPFHIFIHWHFQKNAVYEAEASQYQIEWKPRRRGFQMYPKLQIESKYPFGLLRSWKICQTEDQVLVYPERKGLKDFPHFAAAHLTDSNMGLFQEHIEYKPGDSPRRIDWKASQKTQKLMIKKFEDATVAQLNFDWDMTQNMSSVEDRISQLALWISQAHKENLFFQLSLPNWNSGHSQGAEHLKACMTKLATWTPPQLVKS